MGSFSIMHWLIVAAVVLVLFGRGKVSETMGEFGRGVRNFRKAMSEDEVPPPAAAHPIMPETGQAVVQAEAAPNRETERLTSETLTGGIRPPNGA